MKTIILFGSTGLLGWYIKNYLYNKYNLIIIKRDTYDILNDTYEKLKSLIEIHKPEYVINCTNSFRDTLKDMLLINSLFPQRLDKLSKILKYTFIHISTNGVFSGYKGHYNEKDIEDANNNYGITKLLGEKIESIVIRTSIVGESSYNKDCIIEWLKKNKNNTIEGYTEHYWNGLTCLELAKYIEYIINNNIIWTGIRHICSCNVLSKYQLIEYINNEYKLNMHIIPNNLNINKNQSYSLIIVLRLYY